MAPTTSFEMESEHYVVKGFRTLARDNKTCFVMVNHEQKFSTSLIGT